MKRLISSTILLSSILICIGGLCSCNDEAPEIQEEVSTMTPHMDMETKIIAKAITTELSSPLTQHIYNQRESGDENFIYSPYMTLRMMSLLSNTAREDMTKGIYNDLNLRIWPSGRGLYVDTKILQDYINQIHNYLPTPAGVVYLNTGGAIWTNDGTLPDNNLTGLWNNKYQIENFSLNLAESSAGDKINAWSLASSGNMIESVLSNDVQSNTDMLWTDLMQFKGQFTYSFNPKNTRKENFTCKDGTVREVEMMHAIQPLGFYKDNESGVMQLSIPTGGNSKFQLIIVLPPEGMSIEEAVTRYNEWPIFEHPNANCIVDLALPKFHITASTGGITDALVRNGQTTLFSETASFPGINENIKKINYVQGCSIDVTSEDGVNGETGKNIEWYREGETPHVTVNLNRPFLFSLSMPGSYTPLLVGVVAEPK